MTPGETGPTGPMDELEVAEELCRTLQAGYSGAMNARTVSREAQRLWDLLLAMEEHDDDLFDECFIATMACVDMDCHMLHCTEETVLTIILTMRMMVHTRRGQADAVAEGAGPHGAANDE